MADNVTVENEAQKPDGADFSMTLPDGHVVWFREFQQGQRLMLLRSNDLARADQKRIQGGPGTDAEKLDALTELSIKADRRTWDAIDSRVVDREDVDRIMDAMISGSIDMQWAWKVFRGGADPVVELDDDVEPVQEVKPSRRANVKRTQVK